MDLLIFDRIPYELLQEHIFEYLPLADLKQFGLTSHRCNEISRQTLLKRTCLKLHNFQFNLKYPIVNLFSKSNRNYTNLLLSELNLYQYQSMDFWHGFGVNIKTLYIENCKISPKVLISILKQLPNLKFLSLDLSMFKNKQLEILLINSLKKLKGTFDNLKSLRIGFSARERVNSISLKIIFLIQKLMYSLMPNLEEITIFNYYEDISYCNFYYWENITIHIKNQSEKLKIFNILKNIMNDLLINLLLNSELDLITELNIRLSLLDINHVNKLGKLLQNQKKLESLKIRCSSEFSTVLDSVLIIVCNNGTSLKKLEVFFDNISEAGLSDLYKLRNLETFSLGGFTMPNRMIKNLYKFGRSKLNKLKLSLYHTSFFYSDEAPEIDSIEIDFINQITIHFTNLTHLCLFLRNANDSILQTIIQNLTLLQRLDLRLNQYLTDYGITGEHINGLSNGVSISQLKGLTHLSLFNFKLITEKSFTEIAKCRYLRMLSLRCHNLKITFEPKTLNKILLNYRSLEILEIINPDMTINDKQTLTKNHPRLKFTNK